MKTPQRLEEILVWPPMGGAIAFILFSTLHITLPAYQTLLGEYQGAPYYIGYIFPVIMGSVLAWQLHGKYWLGFAWLGFAFYLTALVLTLFLNAILVQNIFVVCMSLAILQAVQSAWLKLKRWSELRALST